MTTSRSRGWLIATALSALGPGGCAYRVQLLSEPPGARVHLPQVVDPVGAPEVRDVVTPAEVWVPGSPFRPRVVRVMAEGYRALPVDLTRIEGGVLRRIEVAFAGPRPREVTFVLLEEHAPVGTTESSE